MDPNEFFGTPDPVDTEAAYLTEAVQPSPPLAGIRVVAPGEDLSTLINDPLTSVKDVRTPEQFKPFEAIVADLIGCTPDGLRLIKGQQTITGMIAMFEQLDVEAGTFEPFRYVVASNENGRPRVRYATRRAHADRSYDLIGLALGIPLPPGVTP